MEALDLLEPFELDEYSIGEVRNGWENLERRCGTPKAAAEEFLHKVSAAIPKTEHMQKRASTVWSKLNGLLASMHDQSMFTGQLEYLALRHMNQDISAAEIETFKGLLLEFCASKLGGMMTPEFQYGVSRLVDAVGASYQHTRDFYKANLKILEASWVVVQENSKEAEADAEGGLAEEEGEEGQVEAQETEKIEEQATTPEKKKSGERASNEANKTMKEGTMANAQNMNVPTSFGEMARFNASVMGVGDRPWLSEMITALDSLVPNVGNIDRLQEECDVLSLLLWRHSRHEQLDLPGFKSVMFASLRSMLQAKWSMKYENAWSWFWSCIEKMLDANKQLPGMYYNNLKSFTESLDEDTAAEFKLEVFETLFATCVQTQDYLKASNARLQYIMGRILRVMGDIFTKTKTAVRDISALGLLHAGYGVPEDLTVPFTEAIMMTVKKFNSNESIVPGVQWCLHLVGRILTRTLAEGSTAVMQSINKNSAKELQKAVAPAPRGKREQLLLRVQVGTESISPLVWAIETGALRSAQAILEELLTIRADRSSYYYSMKGLFGRHPDIIQLLCRQAPTLLSHLLDGLVWKSKKIKGGTRRVNYYIGSLLVDENGKLTPSLHALIQHSDPEIVCHSCPAFAADLLWNRMCGFAFVGTKMWFILTLANFTVGLQYGILSNDPEGNSRWALIGCRAFMYVFSLGQLFAKHMYQIIRACASGKTSPCLWCCRVPTYLLVSRQEFIEFVLVLFLLTMLGMEPFLHCLQVSDQWLTSCCAFGQFYCDLSVWYDRVSCIPMLLYFVLAFELVHFNIHLSCFAVICTRFWWEFVVYIGALLFLATAFASAIACLPQSGLEDGIQMRDFYNWPAAFQALLSMGLNVYGANNYGEIAVENEPLLKWFVIAFASFWHVYFMNLMVAQLCQRYIAISKDALGYARLTRGTIIFESAMPMISTKRWTRFVNSLRLDEPCELDEGDAGPKGGVATSEGQYDCLNHPSIQLDRVQRYGGLASPQLPWPPTAEEDDSAVAVLQRSTDKRFDEIERLVFDIAVKLGVRNQQGALASMMAGSALHGSQSHQSGASQGSGNKSAADDNLGNSPAYSVGVQGAEAEELEEESINSPDASPTAAAAPAPAAPAAHKPQTKAKEGQSVVGV